MSALLITRTPAEDVLTLTIESPEVARDCRQHIVAATMRVRRADLLAFLAQLLPSDLLRPVPKEPLAETH